MTKRAISIGAAIVLAVSIGGPQAAMAKSKAAPDESDDYIMQMAVEACANQDFKSLLQAMSISDDVRIHYSAATINVVQNGNATPVARERYDDFPIGMLDYDWVTRASMLGWEANPDAEIEHVEMEFNQSQSDQWAVDWVQARYDGNSSEGDDLGEVVERIGEPGVLLFQPTTDCWELSEDSRGQY